MYAEYSDYTHRYGGSLVPEAHWPRLGEAAAAYLDRVTAGRLNPEDDRVLRAACAVTEELWRQEQGGILKSQSVGSWKKTYADGHGTPQQRLYHTAAFWLGETGLLCRWC